MPQSCHLGQVSFDVSFFLAVPWPPCLPLTAPALLKGLLSREESYGEKKTESVNIISTASERNANQTGINKRWDLLGSVTFKCWEKVGFGYDWIQGLRLC